MKLATQMIDFAGYADGFPNIIRMFKNTPFQYLDFGLYMDFSNDNWRDEINRCAEAAEEIGVSFVQAHAKDFKPFYSDKDIKTEIMMMERSLEACAMLGIPNMVVHAGSPEGFRAMYPYHGREEFFEYNKKMYSLLFEAMDKYGVNVLTENSAEANTLGKYYFMKGQEMRDFLDWVDNPRLLAVWDTGHANMRGNNQTEDIIALGDKLAGLHIHDNDGNKDEHTAPYMGILNMDTVMQGLVEIGYSGYFTFESHNFPLRAGGWPYKRRSFDGANNKLLQPSTEIKIAAENMLYLTGKYFLEQYGLFEEK